MLRTFGVVLLSLLLIVSLFGANAALAVDRGPLDHDHMTESAEEAGVYDHVHQEALNTIETEFEDQEIEAIGLSLSEVLAEVLSKDWIQEEAERNTENFYAFLHEEEELDLYIELHRLENDARTVLEREAQDLEYEEFGAERVERLRASESSYADERLATRSELLAEIGIDPDTGYGNPTLAAMIESEASFEAERQEVHDEIVDEMMTEAEDGFGEERLQRLLDSQSSYEAEQTAFREEQKETIQEETDRELSEEELEEAYTDRQDEIIEDTASETEEELDVEGLPAELDHHLEGIAYLTAEALATDMSHRTFTEQYDAKMVDLEHDLSEYVTDNPDEFRDDIREDVEADLASMDVPEPVEEETDDMSELVIEALTSDMSYETFASEYREIADRIDESGAAYAWENREDYEEDFDRLGEEEVGETGLPEPAEEELQAYVDLVLEAALTDMDYDTFVTEADEIESHVVDALVASVFGEEGEIPERHHLTEDLTENAGEELEMAQTAVSLFGLVLFGLIGLSALLGGGIYALTRDLGTTAIATGIPVSVVGGVSYFSATQITDMAEDVITEIDVSADFQAALHDMVGAILAPWAGQSVVLALGGLLVVGAGIAHRLGAREYLEAYLSDEGEED